ncbi:MAG TPA: cytochrome c [Crenotrichaceae bacterium]|nr:cytochrome c [Crenotrichaceae bacterium]
MSSDLNTTISMQLINQGEVLYPSCAGCHGIKAEGISPYPRLAGQPLRYLQQQLTHFRTGQRNNSIMQVMRINLSDDDIQSLALYLSTLNQWELRTHTIASIAR